MPEYFWNGCYKGWDDQGGGRELKECWFAGLGYWYLSQSTRKQSWTFGIDQERVGGYPIVHVHSDCRFSWLTSCHILTKYWFPPQGLTSIVWQKYSLTCRGHSCQRTPQSTSHYSRHHRQSPIRPSTQTAKPPPATRDPTVVWPMCPTYMSGLRVWPTCQDYVSDLRVRTTCLTYMSGLRVRPTSGLRGRPMYPPYMSNCQTTLLFLSLLTPY